MVGVEQGPYVTGKLVKPGQPDALLTTTTAGVPSFVVIALFMVQLWKNKDQTVGSASAWEYMYAKA